MSAKANTAVATQRSLLTGVCVATGALVLALLAAQLPILRSASLRLQDTQVYATARTLNYDDVMVIDVDEPSIAGLASQLGSWPYDRDVYALVHDYLTRSGANAVAYDILFSEPRAGDAEFAAALNANGRAVLIASALHQGLQRGSAYSAQLDKGALQGIAGVPAQSWVDVTLPVPSLLEARGVRLGLNTVGLDAGSIVRRVPLIHEIYGKRQPSLQLAALMAANPAAVLSGDARTLTLGDWRWPLAPSGEVELRFPDSADGIPVTSFHEVVVAALGAQGAQEIANAVRGKTIFIGSSSAILGDFIEHTRAEWPPTFAVFNLRVDSIRHARVTWVAQNTAAAK